MTGEEPRREDASIRRGRAQMQAIVAFMVVLTLAGVTAGIMAGESVLPRIFRLFTTAGFAIAIARGVRWATVLAGIVMVGAAGMCVVTMQMFFDVLPPLAFAFGAGAVISAAAAFQLLFSPQLKAFQEFQRETRERGQKRAQRAEQRIYEERYSAPRKTKKRRAGEASGHAASTELPTEAEQHDPERAEAERAEAERLASERRAERERRAEAEREAKRAEVQRLEQEAQERLARVRAEQSALDAVEKEKHEQRLAELRPARELAMMVGSALVTLAIFGWCWLAWRSAGGRGVGLGPAVTASVTLLAAVLANVGFGAARFVLVALGTVAFLSGLLGSSWSATVPSMPWLAHARVAMLLCAVLGTGGLAWGLERGAARMTSKGRALRAALGMLLGLLTLAWFSPQVARCTERASERFSGCHTLVGGTCGELPGCRPIAGACLSQCEFARSEAACPRSCVWHDRRCTYPSCNYADNECSWHAACTMRSGTCTPSCNAADTQKDCEIAGFACRWVDCAGEPTKSCTEFAYDECPAQACQAVPR